MSWPLSQDYNEAIQDPRGNFADAELRTGEAVTNALGIPLPCSGNFADVYQVRCPSGARWAVKCFTREVHGLRERYHEISAYLRQVNLPFMVDFQYLEQGIRVRGHWYPVLKMHWVEGFTLNAFVRDNLDKPALLEKLSRIWLKMAQRLRESQLGHCDLQHGNVLLVPGSNSASLAVKLIDYDGMWVPALAKTPSGEVGHAAYQHPQRLRDGVYSPEVDRFPLLVIATALRGLSVDGRTLWERYDNGDNLLFRQYDFEAPGRSPLFADLLRMNQPGMRDLAVKLIDAARLPLDQVPHLADLVSEEKPAIRGKSSAIMRTAAAATEPNAFQGIESESTERRSRRQARSGALIPWIVGGSVAACALLGGVLLWALHPRSEPEESSLKPQSRQARADNVVPAKVVEDKNPPIKVDNPKTDGSPPAEKPEDKPPQPAAATAQLLDGPPGEVRRFEGHTAEINGVAISNDGRLALSGGSDGTVRLWDLTTGKEAKQLSGHQDKVQSVAFSRDGRLALTGALDKTARVWDVAEGRELVCFRGHQDWVRSVAFSADGKRALTASGGPGSIDCTVRLWDVANGQEIQTLKGHDKPVTCAVFTPDDRQAVSGSDDGTVRLWDLSDGRELRKYLGHQGHIYGVAVSGDGLTIASVGSDKTIRLWDLKSPKEIRHLDGHTELITSVVFSPDSRRVLSGSLDKTVRWWDRESGMELARFEGHQGGVKCVAFSGDDRFALSAGTDKVVRLWHLPPPDVLAAKPDAPVGEVRVFTGHTANVRRVAFSFDGRHILSAGYDGTARLWETATGRQVLAFNGHTDPHITTVAFLPDGRRALSGGIDRAIRLWDLRDGHEIRAFKEHATAVNYLAVSPDGRRMVSGSGDPVVLVWDVETGEVIQRLEGHPRGVECVGFSPDGRWVVDGCPGGAIHLWDVESGKEIRQFREHTRDVQSFRFSPDARLALTASRDNTLRLWDVTSGKELRHFEGHTDMVEGAALSPDGRRAVSGSRDRTVRLWDVATGKELQRFEGHADKIWDVAFSPDGRYVVSASEDKTLRLWRVPFAPLVIDRPLQIDSQPPPEPAPIAARLPVPDETALKKATEDIRDIYQDDYKNDRRDDLSRKLLKRGQDNQEEPGHRFVSLREARDLAAQAGDFPSCFRVIDEMTKTFTVEEWPMKVAAVRNAAKAARTLSASQAILETALSLFAEAIQADDYDAAESFAKAAEAVAGKVRVSPKVIQRLANEVKRLQKEYADIKPALAKLAAEPKDPEANRLVGSFRCFEKGDWERGLPLLALGDKAKLKELAAKDRAAPKMADAREAVGSGWWTFAKQLKGPAKALVQERACYWYGLVLPEAVEKTRERLEKGIRLHNKDYPSVAWGKLDISQATPTLGALHLSKGDKGIVTRESYSGPIEITVLARTEKNNIRLRAGKGACVIFNWDQKPEELRVTRPDGNDRAESGSLATALVKPLQPNTWYLLSWRIDEEGTTVSVNERVVFSEKHKNDLSEKHPISVNSVDSVVEVLSFTVRPLKKKS